MLRFFSRGLKDLLLSFLGLSFFAFPSLARAEGIVWHPERLVAQGVGCSFSNAPGRPQDAWVVTAGDEISIVYSSLGSVFRNRRNGIQSSGCNLLIPVEITPGFYIASVEQRFFYGIAKQVGVDVSISAVSNFARVSPRGEMAPADMRKTMSSAQVNFSSKDEVNVALGEAVMAPVRVRNDGDADGLYARLCARKRPKELLFHSVVRILTRRDNPNAEVSVAVDGQDLKFDMVNRVAPCPGRVN